MTGSDRQMPHVLLHMWEVVFNLCTFVYDVWCGVLCMYVHGVRGVCVCVRCLCIYIVGVMW